MSRNYFTGVSITPLSFMTRCESGRFSLAIDRCASTSYFSFAQEVEEIRPRFFPPTAQEYIHLSTYLPINLPTYLPTQLSSNLRKRQTQYSVWFDATVRHPERSCFHTKQRNPSLVVVVVFVDISSFPARSRAGDPTLFLSTFLRSQLRLSSARKYRGEWEGAGREMVRKAVFKMATTSYNRHIRECINLISLNSSKVLLYLLENIYYISMEFCICVFCIYVVVRNAIILYYPQLQKITSGRDNSIIKI